MCYLISINLYIFFKPKGIQKYIHLVKYLRVVPFRSEYTSVIPKSCKSSVNCFKTKKNNKKNRIFFALTGKEFNTPSAERSVYA